METKRWIKEAQGQGWRVSSVRAVQIHLRCTKHGCPGSLSLPLANLGPIPPACDLEHKATHSAASFNRYEQLIEELRRRRRQIGLDQADLNECIGFADGYINKLESFARIATFPTLQLWAETLGLSITTKPCPLPPATIAAISERQGNPYQHNQTRFKHAASA